MHFVLVVVSGFIPLRRIFISSLGYLREGRIYLIFRMSQVVLQQRVIYLTLRDIYVMWMSICMIFQVSGGQFRISAFGREDFRCLSLLITTLVHYTYDGKCTSLPLIVLCWLFSAET